VEDDAFQQVSERQILELGERFQDLEDPLLHPHAGLDAVDRFDGHSGTSVPKYQQAVEPGGQA
jgi:hypothetical protein